MGFEVNALLVFFLLTVAITVSGFKGTKNTFERDVPWFTYEINKKAVDYYVK